MRVPSTYSGTNCLVSPVPPANPSEGATLSRTVT